MKRVISSALVPQEKKKEINDAFRTLVYAKSKTLYESSLIEWYKKIEGIEVKTRRGEEGNWILLNKYFDNNWGNTVEMWTMHARNSLPLASENTNNRLESAFNKIKLMLQTLNLGKVSTAKLVCDLVLWSEQLLKERYTLAKRKRMQIFDPDPNIRNIFNEASEHLTDQGCFLFKEMVTKLGNRKPFLSVVGDCAGVKEVFSERTKNQSEKSRIFQTTVLNCSCVWKQHNSSSPCHHILFLRSHYRCLISCYLENCFIGSSD